MQPLPLRPRKGVGMRTYSASHLSKPQIRESIREKIRSSNATEADLLVLLAQADLLKMYLDDGYPSMHAYCVGYFQLPPDVAFRRIHAARAAREYPALFRSIEEGRLHLTAVRLI